MVPLQLFYKTPQNSVQIIKAPIVPVSSMSGIFREITGEGADGMEFPNSVQFKWPAQIFPGSSNVSSHSAMMRLWSCCGKKKAGAAARGPMKDEDEGAFPCRVSSPSRDQGNGVVWESMQPALSPRPHPPKSGDDLWRMHPTDITIRLLQHSAPPIEISVRPQDTILQVKRSIPLQVKDLRRVDHRNLDLFKGAGVWRMRLNCRTLREYGIGAGDAVTVVPSLAGSASFESVPFTPFEDISPERLAAIRDRATAPTNSLAPFAQMAFVRRKALLAEDFIADRIGTMPKAECEEILRFWEEGLPYEPPYLDSFCTRLAPHFIDELAQEAQPEGLVEQEALRNSFLLKFYEKYNKLPADPRAGDMCFCCIKGFADDMQARFNALLEEETLTLHADLAQSVEHSHLSAEGTAHSLAASQPGLEQ